MRQMCTVIIIPRAPTDVPHRTPGPANSTRVYPRTGRAAAGTRAFPTPAAVRRRATRAPTTCTSPRCQLSLSLLRPPSAVPRWCIRAPLRCCASARSRSLCRRAQVILEWMEANLCVDMERVFIAGFSNGGSMTYKLNCELSQRFAGMMTIGARPGPRMRSSGRVFPAQSAKKAVHPATHIISLDRFSRLQTDPAL